MRSDPFGEQASSVRLPDVKAWPVFRWSWARFALPVVGVLWALAMVRDWEPAVIPLGALFTVLVVVDRRQQDRRRE